MTDLPLTLACAPRTSPHDAVAADDGRCSRAVRDAEGRTAGGVGGRAARRGVQGGLSRAFGDGLRRPVAARRTRAAA